MQTHRLIVSPTTIGRFSAHLGDDIVVSSSRQPLVDGARALLARGLDPSDALTMRHQGSLQDSFEPLPISEWAKLTYEERDRGRLGRARWMPLAAPWGPQK